MSLKTTSIEKPGPEDGQALPIVHFTGTSRSMHQSFDPNANSAIRGKWLAKSFSNATLTGLNAAQQVQ